MALRLESVIRERARENQKNSTGGSNPQLMPNSAQAGPITTRDEIAKLAGVGHDTIEKIKIIEREGYSTTKAYLQGLKDDLRLMKIL